MPELNNTILKNSANLKAYYRLESGALTTDSSAGGYTLTNNNTVGDGTGKFGGCADFGASNSNKYFSITSDIGVSATADCSFAFWAKLPSLPSSGNRYSFFGKDITGATGSRYNLSYYNNSGTYQLLGNRSRGASGTDTATYAVTLATDTWYHIVVTYSANTLKVYLNSSFVSSVSSTGTGSVGEATALYLGAWNVGGITQYINGNIDDFSIFTSALTADQVKELYEGRYVGELQPQTGLVALYHLSSITDYSGNHYTLTNNNTVAFNAGKFSNAMDLGTSNTNKYLSIANDMGITSGACSVTMWVKITAEPSSASFAIFERGDSGIHVRHWVRYIDTAGTKTLQFNRQRENAANDQFAPTITALGTSVFHHIAYAYDGSTLVGYLDGVAIGSVASSGNGISGVASDYLYLGHSLHATTLYCDAIIDEVGVWNKNLTASEVRKMYAVGKGRYL